MKTTDWKPYEDAFFRLNDGVLEYIPMMEGLGIMDASDPIEIALDDLDDENAILCRIIEADLSTM